jgi:hypothetical protein
MTNINFTQLDRKISKQRKDWYINQVAKILVEEGVLTDPKQLVVCMGTEIEFNKVFVSEKGDDFDNSPYRKRNLQVITDPEKNIGSRDELFIPEAARSENIDLLFIGNQFIKNPVDKNRNRGRMTVEPAFKNNTATLDVCAWDPDFVSKTWQKPVYAAYAQSEVISPVLTHNGIGNWMEKTPNTIVKEAHKFEIGRVDFTSKTDDQSLFPNSIHLSISISSARLEDVKKGFYTKLENSINLLNELDMCESKDEKSYQRPSQFALAIANIRNKIVSEAFLMYAPTEKAYRRFDLNDVGAPKHIGFFPQRKMLDFGGAAFRGADIRFSRPEDTFKGTDKGPLRIEERIICPEAIGHPNRDAYPDQALMAHELVEMQAYILFKGTQEWQKNRKAGVLLRYEDLLNQKPPIPKNKGIAENLFANSVYVKEMFSDSLEGLYDNIPHNKARYARVINRHGKLERILEIDNYTATKNHGPEFARQLGACDEESPPMTNHHDPELLRYFEDSDRENQLRKFRIADFVSKNFPQKNFNMRTLYGIQATLLALDAAVNSNGNNPELYKGKNGHTPKTLVCTIKSMTEKLIGNGSPEALEQLPVKFRKGFEEIENIGLAADFSTNYYSKTVLNESKTIAKNYMNSLSRELCRYVGGLDRALRNAGIDVAHTKY